MNDENNRNAEVLRFLSNETVTAMRNKRPISKEWLKHNREISELFVHWIVMWMAQAFLVFYFISSALFFFFAIQDDVPLVREMAICLGGHILILAFVITFFHGIQYSEQKEVSILLTGADTFHFLEIIPGKAFRMAIRENWTYNHRLGRYKKLVGESRRRKAGN